MLLKDPEHLLTMPTLELPSQQGQPVACSPQRQASRMAC